MSLEIEKENAKARCVKHLGTSHHTQAICPDAMHQDDGSATALCHR